MADVVTVGIKLTVDGKGVDGAISFTSEQLKKLGQATNQADSEAQKYNSTNKGLMATLSEHANIIKGLAAAYGLYKVVDYIKDATVLASRYETMGVVMKIAGQNAGFNAAQMDDYANKLEKNGISMLKARESLTSMATAGLDMARSVELGRAAQDLAVVANQNSSETLQRLVVNIQQADTVGLRHMGIILKTEEVMQKYAAAHNTTVGALTSHQRSQATLNAVLQEATKYQGIYEQSMTTAGKAMLSLERQFENLKIKVGTPFLKGFAEGVFGVQHGVEDLNKWLDKLEESKALEKMAESFGSLVGGTIDGINNLIGKTREFFDLVTAYLPSIEVFKSAVITAMIAASGIIIVTVIPAIYSIGAAWVATAATSIASLGAMALALGGYAKALYSVGTTYGWAAALGMELSLMAATLSAWVLALPVAIAVGGAAALGVALGYALSSAFGDTIRKLTPGFITTGLNYAFDAVLPGSESDREAAVKAMLDAPVASTKATNALISEPPANEEDWKSYYNGLILVADEAREIAKAARVVEANELVSAATQQQIRLSAINESGSRALEAAYEDRLITHRAYIEEKAALDLQGLEAQRALIQAEIVKTGAEADSGKGDRSAALNAQAEATAKLFALEQQISDLRLGTAREAALADIEDITKRNGSIADSIDATKQLLIAQQELLENAGKSASQLEELKGTRLLDAAATLEQLNAQLQLTAGNEQAIEINKNLIITYKQQAVAHSEMAAAMIDANTIEATKSLAEETRTIYAGMDELYATRAQDRIALAGRNALKEIEIERNKQELIYDLAEQRNSLVEDPVAREAGYERIQAARMASEVTFSNQRVELEKNTTAKIEQENLRERMATVNKLESGFRQSFAQIFGTGKRGWKEMCDDWLQTLKTTVVDYLYNFFAKPMVLNIIASVAGITGAGGVASAAQGALSALGAGGGAVAGGANLTGWAGIAATGSNLLKGGTNIVNNITSLLSGNGFAGAQTVNAAQAAALNLPANAANVTGAGGVSWGNIKGAGLNIGAGIVGSYAGNAVGESLFDKQAESAWGATIGGIVGSMFGPLGTAVGSFIGGLVDVAAGGDGKERLNAGILVAPTPGLKSEYSQGKETFASGLEVEKFGRRTDAAQVETVVSQFRTLDAGVTGLVQLLGGNIDLKGKTLQGLDEEATAGSSGTFLGRGGNGTDQSDITAQFNSYVDQLLDNVTGLDEALISAARNAGSAEAAMQLLADAVTKKQNEIITEVTDLVAIALGKDTTTAFGAVGDASIAMRTNLINLLGGFENLNNTMQSYYQNFFTAEERTKKDMEALSATFKELGFDIMPKTREAFRNLVESQDLSTESGQQTAASLLQLSAAFAQVVPASDSAKTAIKSLTDTLENVRAEFGSAMSAAAAAYQEFVDAVSSAQSEVDSIRDQITAKYVESNNRVAAAQQRINDLNNQGTESLRRMAISLREFITSMDTSDLGGGSTQTQRTALETLYTTQVTAAKAGDVEAANKLPETATRLLEIVKSQSTTAVEYAIEAGKIRSTLSGIADQAETEAGPESAVDPMVAAVKELADAMAEQKKWADAVAATGASLTLAEDNLLAQYAAANAALTQAQADLVAANAIKGDLELRQVSALERFALLVEQLIAAMSNLAAAIFASLRAGDIGPVDAVAQLREAGIKVPEEQKTTIKTSEGPQDIWASGGGAVGLYTPDKPGAIDIFATNGEQFTGAQAVTYVQTQLASNDAMSVYAKAVETGISSTSLDALMGWAPGTSSGWAAQNNLPSFAVGTNYVPKDMQANIHQGERIIPAADNKILMEMLSNYSTVNNAASSSQVTNNSASNSANSSITSIVSSVLGDVVSNMASSIANSVASNAENYNSSNTWNTSSTKQLHSFAVGTNYLPSDMIIQAHEGERIIPKADNAIIIEQLKSRATAGGGVANVELLTEFKAVRKELSEMRTEKRLTDYQKLKAAKDHTRLFRDVLADGASINVTIVESVPIEIEGTVSTLEVTP